MDSRYQFIDPFLFFDSERLSEAPIFVEIGSFTGTHAMGLKEAYPQGQVIVYEASPTNFGKLNEAIAGKDIKTHNQAVGEQDGEIEFFEFSDNPSSNSIFSRRSLFRRNSRGKSVKKSLPCVGVETVLKNNNASQIDVFFSNCEGAELPILAGIMKSADLQNRIRQLSISFHAQIYGQRKVRSTIRKMEECGYASITSDRKWPCTLFYRQD